MTTRTPAGGAPTGSPVVPPRLPASVLIGDVEYLLPRKWFR